MEAIHQPAGPDDPQAHAGVRVVASREDLREIRDPGPLVADGDAEELRSASAFDREADAPATRIAKGVADDLRDGRRDAHLILAVEADELGDVMRALARRHDVALVGDAYGQQGKAHDALRSIGVP